MQSTQAILEPLFEKILHDVFRQIQAPKSEQRIQLVAAGFQSALQFPVACDQGEFARKALRMAELPDSGGEQLFLLFDLRARVSHRAEILPTSTFVDSGAME